MLEIPPKSPHPIDFWIKGWGVGLILDGLSFIPVSMIFPQWFESRWENMLMRLGYGAALIWGKRVQGIRKLGLFLSIFWFGGACLWAYHHTTSESHLFPSIYFLVLAPFYLGLFIFLLLPKVKGTFGSSLSTAPLPSLTLKEERRVKFWVRIIAGMIFLEGLVSSTFSDWYRSHGLPPEERLAFLLEVIATEVSESNGYAFPLDSPDFPRENKGKPVSINFRNLSSLGLLFFRQNIGRRFAMFV